MTLTCDHSSEETDQAFLDAGLSLSQALAVDRLQLKVNALLLGLEEVLLATLLPNGLLKDVHSVCVLLFGNVQRTVPVYIILFLKTDDRYISVCK